jgi:hypothetical protein
MKRDDGAWYFFFHGNGVHGHGFLAGQGRLRRGPRASCRNDWDVEL